MNNRRWFLMASLSILFISLACELTQLKGMVTQSEESREPPPTESVLDEMTSVPESLPLTPTMEMPSPQPPGEPPVPAFNPFENMSPEEETCLRDHWDEDAFQDITTFQRPPTTEEEQAMFACLKMPPLPEGEGGPGNLGPYFHQVMIASSLDGLDWRTDDAVVRDHASVPEIVSLPGGKLFIYFVDGTVDYLDAIQKVADGK